MKKSTKAIAQAMIDRLMRGESVPLHSLAEREALFSVMKSKQVADNAQLLQEEDFVGYISRAPGGGGLPALWEVQDKLTDDQYWEQVNNVWSMAEVTMPNMAKWLKLFQSPRPKREKLMSTEDSARLAGLREKNEIWRGCGHQEAIRGMSWTLDKGRAEVFANYACSARRAMTGQRGEVKIVATAFCRKADVLAYFSERKESEIVVNPAKLDRVTWRCLK